MGRLGEDQHLAGRDPEHVGDAAGVVLTAEAVLGGVEAPGLAVLLEVGGGDRDKVSRPVTRSAVPSTITSVPACQVFVPVVTVTPGEAPRLRCFCSLRPVQNQKAPSCQRPTSGVVCGRPSARTVVIQ